MKKWISVLCVIALLVGVLSISAISASAEGDVEKGVTAIDVKRGDKVTYTLTLDKVAQPIIGSDFSVYYDSSVFDLESVADYNNNTNSDDWDAVINPDLDGQVRGVWSILKGVDFSSKRNFITLNLKAVADQSDTHITYRIRFLYDNSVFDSDDHPQIKEYEFACNVLVNDKEVIKDEPAELDTEKEAENGKFINSLDGKGEHADPNLPGVVDKAKNKTSNGSAQDSGSNAAANNAGGNSANISGGNANNNAAVNNAAGDGSGGSGSGGNAGNNAVNNAGGNGSAENAGSGSNGSANSSAAISAVPVATTADGYFVVSTDAEGNIVATSDEAPAIANADNAKKGSSPVIWIIIAVVVLAGGGAAVYFLMKKPKNADPAAPVDAVEGSVGNTEPTPESAVGNNGDDNKTQSAEDESK